MTRTVTDAPCALLDRLPDGFLDCPANRLKDILPRPTLFDLPGRDPQPLFVSTLLHGNETSGLAAVQETLRRHVARGLGRFIMPKQLRECAHAAEPARLQPGVARHGLSR